VTDTNIPGTFVAKKPVAVTGFFIPAGTADDASAANCAAKLLFRRHTYGRMTERHDVIWQIFVNGKG
jgi:hypothetical protein